MKNKKLHTRLLSFSLFFLALSVVTMHPALMQDALGNQPPVVDAGPDQSVAVVALLPLSATATDDILPTWKLTLKWTKVSGPGIPLFNEDYIEKPKVRFGSAGTYVLRLTASDGELSSYDDVTITVNPVSTTNPVIGMNMDFLRDYTDEWVFKDVFKMSQKWSVEEFNTVTNVTAYCVNNAVVDEYGWPLELKTYTNEVGQLIQQKRFEAYIGLKNVPLPPGNYRAEWLGTGSISFDRAVTEIERGQSNGKHYAILKWIAPNEEGIFVRISSIDKNDPIRDLHIWAPVYNGESFFGQDWKPGDNFSPFHPLFLERLKPFKAIRFMNWCAAHWSTLVHWEDRSKFDYATQVNGNGVAYEYMIELANELHKDVWVNLPHMADENFIRNMAMLFRDNLDSDLKIYVEFGNEIWSNGRGFNVRPWLEAQMNLEENAGLDWYAVAAKYIKRDFSIWRDVFSGQEQRIVRVVAGQAAFTYETELILKDMDGQFDAISAAAYFGAKDQSVFTDQTTLDELFASLDEGIAIRMSWLAPYKELADQYSASLGRHIPLINYEGGQGLVGGDKPYQPLYFAAQEDPRMYTAHQKLLQGLKDLGIELFMYYDYVSSDSRYGSWGALKYQDQPIANAPKYRALLDAVSGELYNSTGLIYGDVSGDGQVTAYDAAMVAQAATNLITLTADQSKAADVSGDGIVSAYDAALIAQRAVNLISEFPVEG